MNIQAESYGHAVILILKGELDADSLGAFKRVAICGGGFTGRSFEVLSAVRRA